MRLTILTVFATAALVVAGGAVETPAHKGHPARYSPPPAIQGYSNLTPVPVWHRLAQMSPAERANAVIDLEREEPLARDIELLWNTGRCERALELFPTLAPEEVGINWRVPIPAPESDWGTPVQVSARDSVMKIELAADAATGNLFCLFRYLGDGDVNSWSINMSTDGGETWSEKATWMASYIIPDISLDIVSGHAYAGYVRASNLNTANVRRYRVTDGTIENFPGGSPFFELGSIALPDSLRGFELAANYNFTNDRLYAFFNGKSGQCRLRGFSTPGFADTFDMSSGLSTDVIRGIDIAWNFYPSAHPLVMSFINAAGNVQVWGRTQGNVNEALFSGAMPSNGSYTAIAAWKDTLHVVHDQQRSSVEQVRYLVRYTSTGSWLQGGIGDTVAGFSRNAAATGKYGDGVGVTYWQYPQNNPGQCFRSRPAYSGNWTPAENIQQGLTTASDRVPAIARVAPGVHGAVFTRGFNHGMAYFNRNDWTGIAEPGFGPVGAKPGPAAIVRGMLELRPTETGELFDASGRKLMRLAAGKNDLRHLAPGVYFLGIEAEGVKAQRKLILAE
jgi:hypothetical protein